MVESIIFTGEQEPPVLASTFNVGRYKIDGGLRGHLDKPHGLDHLNNGTTYGISGNVNSPGYLRKATDTYRK